MATNGQAQQQNQSSDDWIWIVFGVFLILFVIWYLKHDWITNVVLRMRWAESKLLGVVIASSAEHSFGLSQILSSAKDISSIHFSELWHIAGMGVRPFGFLFGALLVGLGFRVLMINKRGKVRKKLDMASVAHSLSDDFPYIKPVLGLDLINDSSAQWAPSLRPESQYDSRGKLVEKGFVDIHGLIESRLFDRVKTKSIFIAQVGRAWPGSWKKLKRHEAALFGIFAARICRDRDGATNALKSIAENFSAGGKDLYDPGIALARKYGTESDVKGVISRHRYVSSVLAGMLEESRIEGVLPSSEFLWLKPVDRTLWYLLNSVGRRVAAIEAAGSFGNYNAEKLVYKSNVKRADLLEKRRQKEVAMQIAQERNIRIATDDDDEVMESSIPDPIVLTGPVVDEAVDALYIYMKEKDLCE